MIRILVYVSLMLCFWEGLSQHVFTRKDSVKGFLTSERSWWDVGYYHLSVEVDPKKKTLDGTVRVLFEAVSKGNTIQIDLQEPLRITKVRDYAGNSLSFTKEYDAYFIRLDTLLEAGEKGEVIVYYMGIPTEPSNPPWEGGVVWSEDDKGNPFIGTACQGSGASIWWPCKDHPSDEVDSMRISITIPDHLGNISNGTLESITEDEKSKTKTFNWVVRNPINTYGVNMNIGKFISWNEVYPGENGDLKITYSCLEYNEEKAKKQFGQVPSMLEAFEYWLGPYPFYEDGYQLVEAPYLGMEHQSSVTYGNGYQNGYKGLDYSLTGWGLKFDYIIIHESAHEWFANSITYTDIADLWIHESFTTYSESLYVEYHFGKSAGLEYLRGRRMNIVNESRIVGYYGVWDEGKEAYDKGATMINMIRHILDDDEKWRGVLRGMNKEFYHQNVTSQQVENYLIEQTGLNLSPIFDQFLRTADLPVLQYFFMGENIFYRWNKVIDGFNMPVDLILSDKTIRIFPTDTWGRIPLEEQSVAVHPDFYVASMKIR